MVGESGGRERGERGYKRVVGERERGEEGYKREEKEAWKTNLSLLTKARRRRL